MHAGWVYVPVVVADEKRFSMRNKEIIESQILAMEKEAAEKGRMTGFGRDTI